MHLIHARMPLRPSEKIIVNVFCSHASMLNVTNSSMAFGHEKETMKIFSLIFKSDGRNELNNHIFIMLIDVNIKNSLTFYEKSTNADKL